MNFEKERSKPAQTCDCKTAPAYLALQKWVLDIFREGKDRG